jgi:hypothetical protein
MPHIFKQGKVKPTCCHQEEDGSYCNKKKKHLVHKPVKSRLYQAGDVVGDYTVDKRGVFIKNK